MEEEIKIYDALGRLLNIGDIVLYSPRGRTACLPCGVFHSHFEKKDGWKMRIKVPHSSSLKYSSDNTAILKKEPGVGLASVVIKVEKPDSYGNFNVKQCCSLRDFFIKKGEFSGPEEEKNVINMQTKLNKEIEDLLKNMGDISL